MQTRHELQARNEALLREVNEQIERVDRTAQEAGLSEDASFEFLCECGRVEGADISCDEHVEMTLAEYEDVRSQERRRLRSSANAAAASRLAGIAARSARPPDSRGGRPGDFLSETNMPASRRPLVLLGRELSGSRALSVHERMFAYPCT